MEDAKCEYTRCPFVYWARNFLLSDFDYDVDEFGYGSENCPCRETHEIAGEEIIICKAQGIKQNETKKEDA
jgi:hypothetical protein